MKNIHILPTDKPSRLWINTINGELVLDKETNELHAQNIYITSNEEIKEGDWCYYENGDLKGIHKVVNGQRPKTMILKKIILTTDPDLIKDGVQAIDDEFLEWFVKNPSCESVETYSLGIENSDTGESGHYKYEIIIPQEEQTKCYCGHTSYCDCGPQEETKQDQVERIYSEEEVLDLLYKRDLYLLNRDEEIDLELPSEWYEKFKKK
jgi:hypothetical protein